LSFHITSHNSTVCVDRVSMLPGMLYGIAPINMNLPCFVIFAYVQNWILYFLHTCKIGFCIFCIRAKLDFHYIAIWVVGGVWTLGLIWCIPVAAAVKCDSVYTNA